MMDAVCAGEQHRVPPGAQHAVDGRLGRPLQLLGQGRAHQAEDVGAARPANHGVRLQRAGKHLRLLVQLRLVEGTSRWSVGETITAVSEGCSDDRFISIIDRLISIDIDHRSVSANSA